MELPLNAQALKQPWVKNSLYGVAVMGAIFIAYRFIGGGSGGQSQMVQTNSGVDPSLAALQGQQNQLQAASSAAASAQSYNLALNAQQNSEKLAEANIIAQTTTAQKTNDVNGALSLASINAHTSLENAATYAQTQTNLATIASNNVIANLNSTVALGTAETAAQVALAAINAQNSETNAATAASTITTLAGISAQTQQAGIASQTLLGLSNNETALALGTVLSNNSTALGTTVSNNAAHVAITQSNDTSGAANTQSNNNAIVNGLGSVAKIASLFFM